MALESAIGAEPLSEWIWSPYQKARSAVLIAGWALRAGTARREGSRKPRRGWSEGGDLLPKS